MQRLAAWLSAPASPPARRCSTRCSRMAHRHRAPRRPIFDGRQAHSGRGRGRARVGALAPSRLRPGRIAESGRLASADHAAHYARHQPAARGAVTTATTSRPTATPNTKGNERRRQAREPAAVDAIAAQQQAEGAMDRQHAAPMSRPRDRYRSAAQAARRKDLLIERFLNGCPPAEC